MKDNFNIEDLFKKNLENLEGKVNPESWSKISQGINAGTTLASGGISTLLKTVLISGGVVAASLTAIYVVDNSKGTEENNQTDIIIQDKEAGELSMTYQDSVINVEDVNDPIIEEFKEEIETALNNIQYEAEIDKELVNSIIDDEIIEEGGVEEVAIKEEVTLIEEEQGNSEENKALIPSGRMEFSPLNGVAPVQIRFVSNAKNETSVKWNFGDGSIGVGLEVNHTYIQPGEFNVTMKVLGKENVYKESKIVEIKTTSSVDNIPNVITPNDDRINDIFSIKTTEIKTFFIEIRDTKGNVVFQSNDKDFEWDGNNLFDEKVLTGTYIYTIIAEGEDGAVFKIPGQINVQY